MSPRPIVFTPRLASIVLGTSALLVILGYTLYALFPLLEGPRLLVQADTALSGVTVISGETERVSFLAVNEEQVPVDEGGFFSVTRAYPPGYTALTVSARDRFGRERVKRLSFITKPYPVPSHETEEGR